MVAGGLAVAGSDHVERMAELAIELRLAVEQYNKQSNSTIRLRVGISTGPVIAGVIGTQRFAYDVWGETVNLACRLESTATAGKIQISPATCKRLKDTYQVEERPSGSPGEPAAYWLGARIEHPALAGVNEPVA
jgi:class 3 adenylate cyclase